MGHEVQVIKAGMLDTADVYAVNKSDLPRAERSQPASPRSQALLQGQQDCLGAVQKLLARALEPG